jgi:DNA-binding transcriptional regulator GbsR (MarR family)
MTVQLSDDAELLVADAIGDVIEHWGFRKALGRVWAVLYLRAEPMAATDLGETLQMSAGGLSTTLTELQRWNVVKRVSRLGERKEYFEAETNLWRMISKVVSERERFVIRSVRERLERAQSLLASQRDATSRAKRARIGQLLSLANTAEQVIEHFVQSQRADFSLFSELLALRSKRS